MADDVVMKRLAAIGRSRAIATMLLLAAEVFATSAAWADAADVGAARSAFISLPGNLRENFRLAIVAFAEGQSAALGWVTERLSRPHNESGLRIELDPGRTRIMIGFQQRF
jgi:hypothetical protein